jgi:hypothetical protein
MVFYMYSGRRSLVSQCLRDEDAAHVELGR